MSKTIQDEIDRVEQLLRSYVFTEKDKAVARKYIADLREQERIEQTRKKQKRERERQELINKYAGR